MLRIMMIGAVLFVVTKLVQRWIDRLSRRIAGPPAPDAPKGTKVIRDIEYKKTPQGPLVLDTYLPEEVGREPLPVAVYIHGGGWEMGNKNQLAIFNWQDLPLHGYAVVSINYRLSDKAVWPAQINDCKAAIRWIREHAKTYNFDPNRIAVMGASAGGHLSALVGTSGHDITLEGAITEDEMKYTGPVQAIVDFYGPTDLGKNDDQRLRFGYRFNPKRSIASRFLGDKLKSIPETVQAANPLTYIKENMPPFLIIHGNKDHVVAPKQSYILHEALQASGNQSELIVIENAGHTSSKDYTTPAMFNRVKDYLDLHLGN